MTGPATREQLVVELSARILALGEDRPRAVAVDGMSGVGKTSLAGELAAVVTGAGRPVLQVSYDDFHHPREVRHRRDRSSAEGYLRDSYDGAALQRLVLEPLAAGRPVAQASYDLATEQPVSPAPVEIPGNGVVLVEGEFLLATEHAAAWDLALLLVGEPAAVLERALARDADLGPPELLRETYLRRYFAAWSLYEERNDPWSRADVVVDLTDPAAPRTLG